MRNRTCRPWSRVCPVRRHGRALRGEGGERHRKPAVVHEWAETAHDRGIKVIIAAAGKAAHLGGVVAAFTPLPVIAVPMKTSDLGGLDSLLSMVQMPSGVPVGLRGHQRREERRHSGRADDGHGRCDHAAKGGRPEGRDGVVSRSRLVMGAVYATQFARRFTWQRRPCSWLQAVWTPIFPKKLRLLASAVEPREI